MAVADNTDPAALSADARLSGRKNASILSLLLGLLVGKLQDALNMVEAFPLTLTDGASDSTSAGSSRWTR